MTTDVDLMTPAHPRWQEFYERLEKALTGNDPGRLAAARYATVREWAGRRSGERIGEVNEFVLGCGRRRGRNFETVTAILAAMGIGLQKTIDFFEQHGAICDCQVIFNVERNAGGEEAGT